MIARRLLIFVALVMGVTALAASLGPRDARFEPSTRSPAPAATPSPAVPTGPAAEPELEAARPSAGVRDVPGEPLLFELDADGPKRTLEAVAGRRLRLAVRSRGLATVQIGADGPIQAIDPDSPARFDLLFDDARVEPVRVFEGDLTRGREIAEIRVAEPR